VRPSVHSSGSAVAESKKKLAMHNASTSIYNSTAVGRALVATLDEFVESGEIGQLFAAEILAQYEEVFLRNLQSKVKTKVTFRNEKIISYRFCQDVWTFILENPTFKTERNESITVDGKIKIIALDETKIAQLSNAS